MGIVAISKHGVGSTLSWIVLQRREGRAASFCSPSESPGCLRDSIRTKRAERPRTVVFDLSGTIRLKKELRIEGVSGLTLSRQSAPGEGITVRDYGVSFRKCSDIIIRYHAISAG
jgi:hypothetical protein